MWGSNHEKQEFGVLFPLFYGSQEERNYARAIQVIKKLAEAGYAPANYTMGMAYHDGKGVKKDLNLAFEYYERAAQAGYPPAEEAVGNFFATAYPKHQACEYCPEKAVEWYLRAAENGNAGAQCNLAHYYLTGLLVEKDPAEAYIWATLAVHCSATRFRPAEVFREQAAALLSNEEKQRVGQRIQKMKKRLPHPYSDHMLYWRRLSEEAAILPFE